MPDHESTEHPSHEGYALFDLDQTLIPWDTQLLFCNWILKRDPWRRILMLIFVAFLPLAKVLGAGEMKRIFLVYLLGLSQKELDQEVKKFVPWLLEQYGYPEVIKKISEEKEQGRLCILTSASPEFYAKEIGKQLGFHHAYGTRFDFRESIQLFPDLSSINHKGSEKVHRLKREEIIPNTKKLENSRAYSDSCADLPILELCVQATLINPNPSLEALGKEKGWEILNPPRPSKNRLHFAWHSVQQLFGLFPI